jgi:hypothetical protein
LFSFHLDKPLLTKSFCDPQFYSAIAKQGSRNTSTSSNTKTSGDESWLKLITPSLDFYSFGLLMKAVVENAAATPSMPSVSERKSERKQSWWQTELTALVKQCCSRDPSVTGSTLTAVLLSIISTFLDPHLRSSSSSSSSNPSTPLGYLSAILEDVVSCI